MKQKIIILTFCSLFITFPLSALELRGRSFFSPRSQSTNAARDLVGSHQFMHKKTDNCCYGTFFITPEYSHSYKNHQIAEYFFNTDMLTIAGSQVTNRGDNHMLADYFGLSPAFQSTVRLKPVIENALVDFHLFLGHEKWYFTIHAPAVWTKSEIKLEETTFSNGSTTSFPALYMTENVLSAPVTRFIDAMKGNVSFGDIENGLLYGIINGARCEKGLSDIQVAVGYDCILQDNGHLGFNLRMAAPTGNRPDSKYFFPPIVGNGKHWEFGVGFTSHVNIWEKDGDKTIALYFDANATHLFKTCQVRSFDFCDNGFGSRFILVKEFDANGNYTGKSLPAINITTLPCNVRSNFQLDMVVMFAFMFNNWDIDLGYNAWLRSKERIDLCGHIEPRKYGFKGIQNVRTLPGPSMSVATESSTTLNGDNFINQAAVMDDPSPRFIFTNHLDLNSAASPTAFTHKLFFNICRLWENSSRATPYLGIGGELEFEGVYRADKQPNKNTASQWGIWFKGGLGF